jgi:hypothetical protein
MRLQLKFLVMLILVMVLIVPILAQEVTPDAVEIVPVEVVEEVPVEEAAPVVVVADDGMTVDLVQVIIGLLTAFAVGGIVGIGGLSVFVQRLQNDTATVTALEKLGASYPPETKEILLGISRGLENIGRLGAEVFDDVPVAEKPASSTE